MHTFRSRCPDRFSLLLDGGILSAVQQGALEDSWLVSALEILLPFDAVLRNVIVSDRHRNKGERKQRKAPSGL